MSAHTTISAEMIRDAASLAGARELDVKRVVLGMAAADVDRVRIISALAALGADGAFLERLATASRPLNDNVPTVGATTVNTKR